MIIGGFQKVSLIDYPGKIGAIIFTQGCNFRCPYCHNPELVDPSKFSNIMDVNQILDFLTMRIGKLDAVTITGGEPTLQHDLEDFIKKIKEMGYLIKLDSNGTNTEVLKNLIDKNLIDYIAMDIKAPMNKYMEITRQPVNIQNIKNSVKLIMKSEIDYEFRTTIVNNLLNKEDIMQIGKEIKGAKRYFLQNFRESKSLDESFHNSQSLSEEDMNFLKKDLQKYIKEVDIR